MQLRQAYGPSGKAQKAVNPKGKQAGGNAQNKSRRFLVQSDGFGHIVTTNAAMAQTKASYNSN